MSSLPSLLEILFSVFCFPLVVSVELTVLRTSNINCLFTLVILYYL